MAHHMWEAPYVIPRVIIWLAPGYTFLSYFRSSCGPLVMTSTNGKIFPVTGFLWGEFTGHRWIPFTKARATQSFDVFFDLRLNKWLSKQSRRRWFETPSRSLWRHCNVKLLALSGSLKWENCNIIFAPRDLCIGLTFSPSNLYGVLYCRIELNIVA